MTDVHRQLEEARKNLLDLSLRNKLLNFRAYKLSTIETVKEIPRQIYHRLVLAEKSMQFLPKEEVTNEEKFIHRRDQDDFKCLICQKNGVDTIFGDEETAFSHLEEEHGITLNKGKGRETKGLLWSLPALEDELEPCHQDRFLQTPHEESDLQKRLFHIYYRARSLIEDAGYNALHLALGFLNWKENPDTKKMRKAPLILIPVELHRKKATSVFHINWNGEEILTNLSLQLKLEEQGVDLPDFEMPDTKSGVYNYLLEVEKAVSDLVDWEVMPQVFLGFFDFTKFVMYKDLDPDSWPEGQGPLNHPLVRSILDSKAEFEQGEGFSEDRIDEELKAEDLYHVLDADPSQIAVIEDVKSGRNLVVEGPPGTGKSQTIVNLIAETLAQEKTVLFVSEKMAALDVVKERLDNVGIGDFCLELHSHKSRKVKFLKELERVAKIEPITVQSLSEYYQKLESLKNSLNQYVTAISKPLTDVQRTPYSLLGMKEAAETHFNKKDNSLPYVKIEEAGECKGEEWNKAISSLENLGDVLPHVYPVASHPWRGCYPEPILPRDEREIQKLLDQFQEELRKLESELEPMAETYKTLTATTPYEFDQAINAAQLILNSPKVTREILENEEWDKNPSKADSIIDTLYRLKSFERSLTQKFHDRTLNQDPTPLLEEYRELAPKLTRFLRRRYWQVKGEITDLYKINLPGEHKVISDLEELRSYRRTLRKIQAYKPEAESFFGPHWKGAKSNPQKLEEFSTWIIQFKTQIRKGILQEEAINLVINGFNKEKLKQAIQNSEEALTSFNLSATKFLTRVDAHAEEMFGKPLEEMKFEELKSRLEMCQDNLSSLQPWSTYIMKRKQCLRYHGNGVVTAVERGDLDAEDIVPCFKGNFADEMLNETFSKRPVLAQFLGEAHEKRIQRFRELDKKLIRYNQERLKAKLLQRKPALLTGASRGSEVGILLHEMGKKRRHMPIRILMNKAGSLIRKFKPCFMMSPLSVSQYLDPGTMNFDLVIFDEASQVKPEDALGAIMRGEQLVVMGDTNQLPPTTFFDHIMEKEESYQEWIPSITDVESILYKCREVFPTKTLRWHYRSKHESLITISNQEFYDNRLVVFPSPLREDEYLGLKFNHIPETTYDRGGTRINREEARKVAQAALDHYKKYPKKSLGVGTFSTAQQEAILEEVEILRKQHPEMDKYFSHDREEYFFVKNLETIQGDERDVIYISVGYGFDESDNITLQFGPLTYTGGWKRLNVLITRAREQCRVFSNFTAYDLKLQEDTKKGIRSLKVFLKYAQDRNLYPIAQVGRETDSTFIECVKSFLEDKGYEVHPQVGTAGFRIDLAIVHPEKDGEYLLAVECDGPKYYTSKVARERDRLRQQVLTDRGWIIHQVWSPDWYRNREAARQRLLEGIEIAKNNPTPHTKTTHRKPKDPPIAVTPKEGGHTINHQDLEDLIPPYPKCNSLSLPDLTEKGYSKSEYPIIDELSAAIQKIVEEEGPVSVEQVLNRIREYSPIERITKKIHTAINNAIKHADLHGKIEQKGKFLWPNQHNGPLVRRRTGDISTDIDQICDEEIAEAARIVLRHQFSTPKPELITQTSRLMGIQRTTTKVSQRITQVIDRLLQTGELNIEEGQLSLPKTKRQSS